MSSSVIAPTWASLEQAAEYLGCSAKTVRRLVADDKLPAYRLGGRQTIRVRLADLDGLLSPLPTAATDGVK